MHLYLATSSSLLLHCGGAEKLAGSVKGHWLVIGSYRCFLSGVIPRQARHIMTPPTTRIAAPIQPTKRAGPKVYLKEDGGKTGRRRKEPEQIKTPS